ncbi:MAG: LuxR C-terminal-related transcriptional regulator [Sphingobium sp.]
MADNAALARPTDEYQVREWCRTGLKGLLNLIGHDAFEPALLSYLHLIVRVHRVATAWTSQSGPPRVAAFGEDEEYRSRIAGSIPQNAVASGIEFFSSGDDLLTAGLGDEIRLTIVLGTGSFFIAFLGRQASSEPWSEAEVELANRSLSLLKSVITAHWRCQNHAEPPAPVRLPAERRLVQAFEQRGLSSREGEIASKILFGYSTLAIAMDLHISENTVKVHRKHLNQKLGVRSQAELFGFAYKALMDGEPL